MGCLKLLDKEKTAKFEARFPGIINKPREGAVCMGLRHKKLAVEGVQFHPESILTEYGKALLANWLKEVASP